MHTSSDILGHPKGLFVCFATEMWERFSYYGMRALLILYLTKHWEFSDAASYLIYGAYTSLVYIMPVFGGMLADQILGSKKAVTYGAILLVFGHFPTPFPIFQEFGMSASTRIPPQMCSRHTCPRKTAVVVVVVGCSFKTDIKSGIVLVAIALL